MSNEKEKYPGDGKGYGVVNQMNEVDKELKEFNKWLQHNPNPTKTDIEMFKSWLKDKRLK